MNSVLFRVIMLLVLTIAYANMVHDVKKSFENKIIGE